jgi:hypothetical protein
MATKTEWFRYETERSGAKRPKQPRRPRGRADGQGATHNASPRAGKHAAYALEPAGGGRPSRKSSRKAANRQKTDVQFRLKHKSSEVKPRTSALAR